MQLWADADDLVANKYWRGARFTLTYKSKSTVPSGIEVKCCHPLHHKCRLRRHFQAHDGRANVERLLKEWIVGASRFKSQKTHRVMRLDGKLSFEQLEVLQPVGRFKFELADDDRRKRRRVDCEQYCVLNVGFHAGQYLVPCCVTGWVLWRVPCRDSCQVSCWVLCWVSCRFPRVIPCWLHA